VEWCLAVRTYISVIGIKQNADQNWTVHGNYSEHNIFSTW